MDILVVFGIKVVYGCVIVILGKVLFFSLLDVFQDEVMMEGSMGVIFEFFIEVNLKVGYFYLEFVFSRRSKLRKFKFVFLRKKVIGGEFLDIDVVVEGIFFFKVFYYFSFEELDENISFFLLGGVMFQKFFFDFKEIFGIFSSDINDLGVELGEEFRSLFFKFEFDFIEDMGNIEVRKVFLRKFGRKLGSKLIFKM